MSEFLFRVTTPLKFARWARALILVAAVPAVMGWTDVDPGWFVGLVLVVPFIAYAVAVLATPDGQLRMSGVLHIVDASGDTVWKIRDVTLVETLDDLWILRNANRAVAVPTPNGLTIDRLLEGVPRIPLSTPRDQPPAWLSPTLTIGEVSLPIRPGVDGAYPWLLAALTTPVFAVAYFGAEPPLTPVWFVPLLVLPVWYLYQQSRVVTLHLQPGRLRWSNRGKVLKERPLNEDTRVRDIDGKLLVIDEHGVLPLQIRTPEARAWVADRIREAAW